MFREDRYRKNIGNERNNDQCNSRNKKPFEDFHKLWNKWTKQEYTEIKNNNLGDMYKFILYDDAPHFLWYNLKVSTSIIKEIKKTIKIIVTQNSFN